MNNPFSNLFGSLFATKDTSVIGIDIGSSCIKFVQLKKKSGRAVLETYGEIFTGPYNNTDLGRATVLDVDKVSGVIKDLLKESNATTIKSCMSIPVSSSLLSFIKMPTTDERKLVEMVPLEARKYIPVPISEVSLDWWPIPKDESTFSEFQNGQKTVEDEKSTEILLVAIHNDALNRNKEIQRITGLDVTFSEIEIFSNVRSVLEPSTSSQMIIDFGAGSTKVFIVEKGVLRASHTINKGSQDITLSISRSMNISFEEAEKIKMDYGIIGSNDKKNVSEVSLVTIDYILAETSHMILSYYKKTNKKISKIVLAGGGAMLKGLKEKAQEALEIQVDVADPFSKLEYPAFLTEVLKTAGPEFSVAIGLTIRKLQEM